jgi:hypothetical protein
LERPILPDFRTTNVPYAGHDNVGKKFKLENVKGGM